LASFKIRILRSFRP